jgi:hypothetical protein
LTTFEVCSFLKRILRNNWNFVWNQTTIDKSLIFSVIDQTILIFGCARIGTHVQGRSLTLAQGIIIHCSLIDKIIIVLLVICYRIKTLQNPQPHRGRDVWPGLPRDQR